MKKFIKDNDELVITLCFVWITLQLMTIFVERINNLELVLIEIAGFLGSNYMIFLIKRLIKIIKSCLKNIVKFIRNNAVLLVTIVIAGITFLLWFCPSDKKDFGDLWLNISSGFISSIFTIVVIDKILKKQKEIEDKPIQLALYSEMHLFTTRVISLWEEMYVQCNIDRKEISIDELFSEETIDFIFEHLDLRGYPAIIPKQDWFTHIEGAVKGYMELGNKIIDRYIFVAEPELIQALQHFVNGSAFSQPISSITTIRNIDLIKGIPRPTILMCYTVKPTEEDRKIIKYIIQWCSKNYEKLKDDNNEIYKIREKIIIMNKHIEPTSIMTSDELNKLVGEFDQFVKQKTK